MKAPHDSNLSPAPAQATNKLRGGTKDEKVRACISAPVCFDSIRSSHPSYDLYRATKRVRDISRGSVLKEGRSRRRGYRSDQSHLCAKDRAGRNPERIDRRESRPLLICVLRRN